MNRLNIRNRRLRMKQSIIDIASEVNLTRKNIIRPIFICENIEDACNIVEMPGVRRYHVGEDLLLYTKRMFDQGIKSFLLFPYIRSVKKCDSGEYGYQENNIVCKAIQIIKASLPEANIMSDIALDPYTSHGHDGILTQDYQNIDNDKTLELLVKQALNQASAGCDFVCPSDMMDGTTQAIRVALDSHGFVNTGIISYAAKFASNLYSPFRTAIGSESLKGPKDKTTYQIDPRCKKLAIKSISDNINQGADAIIIKPSMLYLDIILEASQRFDVPILAYQVSGEYLMLYQYSQSSGIEFQKIQNEALVCIKRAGATSIITYSE